MRDSQFKVSVLEDIDISLPDFPDTLIPYYPFCQNDLVSYKSRHNWWCTKCFNCPSHCVCCVFDWNISPFKNHQSFDQRKIYDLETWRHELLIADCSLYSIPLHARNNLHCSRFTQVDGKVVLLCCKSYNLLWESICARTHIGYLDHEIYSDHSLGMGKRIWRDKNNQNILLD